MLRTGRRSRVSPITHFISRHGGVVTKSYSECFKSPGTVSYGEVNRQFLPCNDLNNLARLMDTHLNPKYYICERWEPDLNCACVGSWTLYYYSSRTILDSPLNCQPIYGDLSTLSCHYSIFAGLASLTSFLLAKDVSYISCRERERLETTADLIEGLYLLE